MAPQPPMPPFPPVPVHVPMPPQGPFPPPRPPEQPRTPEQRRRLTVMLISVVAVVVLLCGVGGAVYFLFFRDAQTNITNNGWKYSASQAHLHTATSLNGATANPGTKFLYFTVGVANTYDRTEPSIGFHFAVPLSQQGSTCDTDNFSPNVVRGYCVSRDGSLLGGGTTCYDYLVPILHIPTQRPLAQGDSTTVTCVYPVTVSDNFDVGSVKVYFVGSAVPNGEDSYDNVINIPTK
jgi:hypothetical protein